MGEGDVKRDEDVKRLIAAELQRQQTTLQMIPSENYASEDVLAACGSLLNNKYAEGYPGKRYYQGNAVIDEIELLAIERAKKLFGAEHANVQSHSGAPANLAVYHAFLNPGDKIMALNIAHGGHLTHGSPVNFSGKTYTFVHYGVDQRTGMLDMSKIREIARREKPKLIMSGFTAYPRTIDFKAFHQLAEELGAYSMADISHIAGLIAAGVHPSPFPFTDIVTTTTHKTLRGPRGAMIFCKENDRLREKYRPQEKKTMAQLIDSAVFPGLQGGPHMHSIAAKAVALQEAMRPEFKKYAQQIVNNARALAETLRSQEISLVSDGTDNHLILIDLLKTNSISKPGFGKQIAMALEEAGIVTNANGIPFDPAPPFKPSGIRLGTPALTTRGMKEKEMKEIGMMIGEVIHTFDNPACREHIREKVKQLCQQFPVYVG
ncbi:MAG: serine hydroxymethyltransferase [Nanoarchaeota archaeon]|nr:serine hydroxymethyltransferase [Nanoarchaeota archaeon]